MKKGLLWLYNAFMVWVIALVIATVYRVFVAENISGEELKGNLGLIAFFILISLARYSGRIIK